MAKRPVAIVDAYSSANQYAKELNKRGFDCIHIQSTEKIPNIYQQSFCPYDFVGHVIHRGDQLETLEEIKKFDPVCLFVGIESGVELADLLSEQLQLKTNGSTLSLAKRDKFEMDKVLAAQSIRVPRFTKVKTVQEAINWRNENKDLKKIVVKPLKSAGTDCVSVCSTLDQIEESVLKILGNKNLFGIVNEGAFLQEFIDGTEYVVNTVSCEGQVWFPLLLQYEKVWSGRTCGRSQVQLTIDAYLCQNKLKELPFTYKRKLFAKVVNFISHHCGVIVSENKLQEIKALQSFAGMRTRVHTGKKLEKTIDLATSPGFVFLAHSDSVQLENDYAQIRSWEKEGLLFSLK